MVHDFYCIFVISLGAFSFLFIHKLSVTPSCYYFCSFALIILLNKVLIRAKQSRFLILSLLQVLEISIDEFRFFVLTINLIGHRGNYRVYRLKVKLLKVLGQGAGNYLKEAVFLGKRALSFSEGARHIFISEDTFPSIRHFFLEKENFFRAKAYFFVSRIKMHFFQEIEGEVGISEYVC